MNHIENGAVVVPAVLCDCIPIPPLKCKYSLPQYQDTDVLLWDKHININSMVQHPVARVLQKFINLHRTQLQSYGPKHVVWLRLKIK
jgi:hypothetical protein